MNILITDKVDPLLIKLLEKHNITYEYNTEDEKDVVLKKINKFEGIIVRNRLKIDADFLLQAKHLKFIARYGSGMESINVKMANELSIKCFNSAEGNCNSVGEHALGMLLSLFHNINSSMNQLKNQVWNREGNRGIELNGKTVGIIGYGNTGHAFAQKLRGFGCRVIGYDKYKSGFGNNYITECDIKTMYANAEIISLHIPLSKDTSYLLNNQFIKKMKNPFYVINTSRGGIVSTKDLIVGLKEKKILGACLDVIENEKSTFSGVNIDKYFNYLLNCQNVIMTPHIAGLSKESNKKLSNILIEKILELT